jgi:hypothetical protein
MPEQAVLTKAQIVARLRSTGSEAVSRLRAAPPTAFEAGRYENGWTGRQILAHIAAIEWTYVRLFDLARQAGGTDAPPAPSGPVRRTTPEESAGLPTTRPRGGIDDYNARQVEKRADASVEELVREFETNRAATVAAVEGADEALLQTPIRSAGGITGTLAAVLNAVAVEHVMSHVGDVLGEPWDGQRW